MNWNYLLKRYTLSAGRLPVVATCLSVALLSCGPMAFGDSFFDNDSNDGLWETASNWENDALPDGETAELYLEDLNNPLPTVDGFPTVTLSSGNHSPTDFVMGGASDTDLGDIQLLMTGGTLNLSSDTRIGRGGDTPDFNNFHAKFTQTGGDVVVTGGSGVDIKLGAGGETYSPAATYSISGGSLSSEGTVNFGSNSTLAGPLTFEIVGTGPSSIVIEDIKTESSVPGATSPGGAPTTLSFVLDSGGVTPLQVNDDLQMENLSFGLSLSDVPPSGDITLVKSGRITGPEQFIDRPDGSDVTAPFDGNFYTWTINYFEDDGLVDAVVLSNLRVSPIPEPTSMVLLTMAGIPLILRRRR